MLPKKRSLKAPTKRVATKAPLADVDKKPKKKTADKSAVAVKKVTKKVVSKAAKRTTLHVDSAPKRVSRARKTALHDSDITESESVTIVEGTISKRLLAKREAYEVWFSNRSLQDVSLVTSVFGYVFIVCGFILSANIFGFQWFTIPAQTAALPCADGAICEHGTDSDAKPSVIYVTNPEIQPEQDLVVTAEIKNIHNPTLVVTSDGAAPLRLAYASVDSSVYTFRVPASTFLVNEYCLHVEGETTNQVHTSFTGPRIIVPSTLVPSEGDQETAQASSTTETVEQEVLVDWEVEPYQLSLQDREASESFGIEFTSMYKFEQVAIYARPDQAVQEFLLGQAESRDEVWVYALEPQQLPQGTYTIIAKGLDQNEVKGEAMISFRNIFSVTDVAVVPDTPVDASSLDEDDTSELLKALSIENHAGTTSEHESEDQLNTVSEELDEASGDKIASHIEDILKVFALAKQSNHSLLLRSSEKALEEAISSEVMNFEQSNADPLAVASFENELRSRIKKEMTVLVVYAQNSSEFYPQDTDQDGITDTEEALAGGTNLADPDTDRDGYLDGIEQLFGYNPASYEPESVLRLERITTEAPIIETLLGIESVTPFALYAHDSSTPVIYQEIVGYGIPNSYALIRVNNELASFILIDDLGKFKHILETELSDGSHTVSLQYLANSGVAIASGRIFSFTKDSKSTNYIKAAVRAPVMSASLYEAHNNPYLPAAVGVVAFGLVLLYLSRAMRLSDAVRQKKLA